jgi:hypothetical protein
VQMLVSRAITIGVGWAVAVGFVVSAYGFPYRLVSLDFRLKHVAVVGDSYTTGTDEGGLGARSWAAITWQTLAQRGLDIAPDVSAEGRAGYAVAGDHGSLFEDLTVRVVKPGDALVVFFGSRNDDGVGPEVLIARARDDFALVRRIARSARLLVIGPPWPTADVPASMLQVRDMLGAAARAAGAVFVDPIKERWFVDRPDLIGPDGVHPTDAGHLYLSGKIAPLVRAQLSR